MQLQHILHQFRLQSLTTTDKEATTTIPVEVSVTEHYNDQIRELANSDKAKDAHEKLIETITKFRDEKQELHDIVECDNDLWWDSSYPPLHFYTLVYDDEIQSPMLLQPPMSDNVLMDSVLQFLSVDISNAIYDSNWREERKKNAVHSEFYALWNNFDSILQM